MAAKGKTIIATIHQPSSQVKISYTVTHHLIPYLKNFWPVSSFTISILS